MEFAGLLPENTHGLLRDSTVHNQEKEKRRRLLPRLMTSSKSSSANELHPHPDNWVSLHSPSSPTRTRRGTLRKASGASISDSSDIDPDLDPAFAVRPRDSSTFATAPPFVADYSIVPERHLHRAPPGIEAFGGVDPLDSARIPHQRDRTSRERRRPAPLTLPLPLPHPGPVTSSTVSTARALNASTPTQHREPLLISAVSHPSRVEREGRDEYFATKFEPVVPASRSPPSQAVPPKALRRGSLTAGLSALNALGAKATRRASMDTPSPTSPQLFQAHQNAMSIGKIGWVVKSQGSTATRSEGRGVKPKASRSKLAGLFKRS